MVWRKDTKERIRDSKAGAIIENQHKLSKSIKFYAFMQYFYNI